MRNTNFMAALATVAATGFGLACAGATVAGGSRADAGAEAGAGGQGGASGQGGGRSGGAGGGASPSDMGGASDTKPADTGGAGGGGGGAGGGAGGAGGSGGSGAGGSGGSGGGAGGDPGAAPTCTASTTPGEDAYPTTREEMFCYVNSERSAYSFHGRSECCRPVTGCSGKGVSWPIKMIWDAGLAAEAQAEAVRVAEGGTAKGPPPWPGAPLWAEGCGAKPETELRSDATRYMITTTGDPPDGVDMCAIGCDSMHRLSFKIGINRMVIYYFDPGSAKPKMTRLGVGMAVQPDGNRTWVLDFGP